MTDRNDRSWAALAPARRAHLAYWLERVRSEAQVEEVEATLARHPTLTRLAGQWEQLDEKARQAAYAEMDALFRGAAYDSRPYCLHCGTCCHKAGPTLYPGDEPLLRGGRIGREHLLTLRVGEPVRSRVDDRAEVLRREQVRLAGLGPDGAQGVCSFFSAEEERCTLHPDKPRQCREQRCWDTRGAEALLQKRPLDRLDLLDEAEEELRREVKRHEEHCSPLRLRRLALGLARGQAEAEEELAAMLRYDQQTRQRLLDEGLAPPSHQLFLLGRPLLTIARDLGFDALPET